jgi:plastocyanin
VKLLALIVAAALVPLAVTPFASAKRRTAAPKAKCAKAKKPRKRACARLRGVRLTSTSYMALLGVPGGFATPRPFATTAPVAPVATAPGTVPETEEPVVPPTLPPIYSNPRAVQVQAFEFGLQLSKATVSSGNVRVEFNSTRAEDPHDLFLVRSDGTGTLHQFDEQAPGGVSSQSLPLTTGRWKLFCTLPGHEALGMKATLTVNAG